MTMQNPYTTYADQLTDAVLDGERVQVSGGEQPDLPDRLRMMAYYLCENQKTAGDALFGMDLHAAADVLDRLKAIEAQKSSRSRI